MSQAGVIGFNPSSFVLTLTGNSGGPVPPAAGNINILGSGVVTVAGNPGTSTLTISVSGIVASSFPTDSGTAVPAAGVLNVFGDTHNITTTGAGNTINVKLTGITQHSLQVGGASNALTQLGVATNGQLPIGSTGADPVLATITAGTGISVTNGAGSITIATTGSTNPVTTLHTQDGNNVTATAGVINISGGNSLTTTGTAGPNTVTISLTGVTQYNVQTGGASNALNNVAPTATSGVPLISQGAASQPIFGTALIAGGGTASTSFNTTGVVISGATSTTALTAVTLTDGQLAIGSSTGNPAAATLTAGTGISITNGHNSITISATGTTTLTVTSVNHAASPYTVLTTDEFLAVDVTAGVVSILLPNAPATGRVFYIKDSKGLAATSNITVTTVGGAVNIDGATSFVMNTAYESISVIFDGTAYEVF